MKAILLIFIVLIFSFSVFSQNRLDSLYYGKNKKNENTNTTYKEPKSQFLYTLRLLFGISGQGMYAYENGKQQYYFNGDEGYLPASKYDFAEGMFRAELSTPIINLSKTWSFNSFSNDYVDNYHYEKTHIDFFGLTRLEMYLKKAKQPTTDWMMWEMWLPIYDRKKIKSDIYEEDDLRIGVFYNWFAYHRNKKTIKNLSYTFDNQTYNGTLNVTYNRFYLLDSRGIFDEIRIMKYHWHKLFTSIGMLEDYKKAETFKFMNYAPLPYVNLYIPWGKFSVEDENGTEIHSGKLTTGLGVSLGIQYSGQIMLDKINAMIVPEFAWQFMDFTAVMTEEDENGQAQVVQDIADARHKYFYAGIGLQFFF